MMNPKTRGLKLSSIPGINSSQTFRLSMKRKDEVNEETIWNKDNVHDHGACHAAVGNVFPGSKGGG